MRFDSSWRVLWTVEIYEWVGLDKLGHKTEKEDEREKWDLHILGKSLEGDDVFTDDPEVTPVLEDKFWGSLGQSSGQS